MKFVLQREVQGGIVVRLLMRCNRKYCVKKQSAVNRALLATPGVYIIGFPDHKTILITKHLEVSWTEVLPRIMKVLADNSDGTQLHRSFRRFARKVASP